jgi:dihydrofolate reductase
MTELIMIAAASENHVLGKDNDLVWRLPDDFKRFKQLTSGHPIIMGRKTFESLPGTLPNRHHIIITRDQSYEVDSKDCTVVHSIEEAVGLTQDNPIAYIVGGGEIYKKMLPMAHKIELTRVHTKVEGDTYFPEIDLADWILEKEELHPSDERHAFAFTYLTYIRR